MYYIKGINEILKSIHSAFNLSDTIRDLSDNKLNSAYHDFLRSESVFEDCEFSNEIKLTDFDGLKNMCRSFYREKEKHFSINSPVLKDRLSNGFFRKSLSQLEKQNHEIFMLANFVVKVILINQLDSYTDGTTEKTIGLACMDFKDHLDEQDFIELVIHQMTHMVLFIDDHSDYHMPEQNKAALIETGINYVFGGTKFPAYQAFHSYIVGVEVLNFRWQSTGLGYKGKYHGDTARIIRLCRVFKNCIIEYIDLFSKRGQSIFNDSLVLLDKACNAYDAY